MKRDTIKKHIDFATCEDDPIVRSAFFLVRAKPAKFTNDARYGLVATKRSFRLAVMRNLAKRKLRDWIAYTEGKMLPTMDYIFIARPAILFASRDAGRAAMDRALEYIRQKYEKK